MIKLNDSESYTFFWSGPFSQWHKCTFKSQVTGKIYNCTEQYMMEQKALFFGDEESAAKIMTSFSPKVQKALGRKVKNFNEKRWNEVCQEIVYEGNWLKFTQNQGLRQLLLNTVGTELVEASPTDRVWGIMLKENDPRALTKATWLGTNWLGFALTRVRDDIILMSERKH